MCPGVSNSWPSEDVSHSNGCYHIESYIIIIFSTLGSKDPEG